MLEPVHHTMAAIKPGMTVREYAQRVWEIPDRFLANRYHLSAHGCGATGEYPDFDHLMDYPDAGRNGVIETGMTLCVESYLGEAGGAEGVNLERRCFVTESGLELVSDFPFEPALMGGVAA